MTGVGTEQGNGNGETRTAAPAPGADSTQSVRETLRRAQEALLKANQPVSVRSVLAQCFEFYEVCVARAYLYSLRFCLLLSWQLLLTWRYNLFSEASERCECHGCARCHSFSNGRAMERQQRERRQYVTASARRGHQRKPCVFNSGFGVRPASFRAWLVRVHCTNGFLTTSCCEHRTLQPVRLTKAGPVSIYSEIG